MNPSENFKIKDPRLNFWGVAYVLPDDANPKCTESECAEDSHCDADRKCCKNYCGGMVCTPTSKRGLMNLDNRQQCLWAPCQIVVSNDFPRDFGPWVAFVSEVQIPVSRQGGGREMSAPRPYVTDPFHPLSSIHITNNFYLYRTVSWLFPTCDTFKCVLVRCTIDNSTCALD